MSYLRQGKPKFNCFSKWW